MTWAYLPKFTVKLKETGWAGADLSLEMICKHTVRLAQIITFFGYFEATETHCANFPALNQNSSGGRKKYVYSLPDGFVMTLSNYLQVKNHLCSVYYIILIFAELCSAGKCCRKRTRHVGAINVGEGKLVWLIDVLIIINPSSGSVIHVLSVKLKNHFVYC